MNATRPRSEGLGGWRGCCCCFLCGLMLSIRWTGQQEVHHDASWSIPSSRLLSVCTYLEGSWTTSKQHPQLPAQHQHQHQHQHQRRELHEGNYGRDCVRTGRTSWSKRRARELGVVEDVWFKLICSRTTLTVLHEKVIRFSFLCERLIEGNLFDFNFLPLHIPLHPIG